MQYMTARHSKHILDWRRFVPFTMISPRLEGFTLLAPGRRTDLVHSENRIPLGAHKFILSFEDSAPRRFGFEADNALTRYMDAAIASHRCRRLIAMSNFARNRFLDQHRNNPALPALQAKLAVRYPNIVIGDTPDLLQDDDGKTLVLTFVGAHFARKGGCVAVKIAEKALAAGVPLRVNIISPLVMGETVWTDPSRPGFYDEYKALLNLDNVRHFPGLPYAQMREMLGRSHFGVLTTFADSFGFSAIEAMAEHTPVLGTRVCALPEVIDDGVNGILIDMPVDRLGMWLRPQDLSRASPAYEAYFRSEVDRIAEAALQRLAPLVGDGDRLRGMRRAAKASAIAKFDSHAASDYWDGLYDEVAAENVASVPRRREPLPNEAAAVSATGFGGVSG
ncbi:glycosyltransferase family 4 protein [Paracoccus laeviglucosivorans]|uniref:Glycosyltransferase involved in cell wall bisynthesis n=1 Tax=Paracoccus laeviglucosivorans TaxID=1197861 RepID=A0A521ERW6_9RHOB|nr:glycosyltransferase family 4 protein [Paracoccus laeviglucosivorans]SMO86673.1 Glycosyltransferase involved in cell wall bisynthesis [Paracoccus laeviglucosivorans]